MKKIYCLVLSIFVITSVLVGCQTNKNQVPNINTNDTQMLKEKYITPIVNSCVGCLISWEVAEDINHRNLFEFYQYSGNLYDYDSKGNHATYYYNQEKVENFIMKYFDVTSDSLKESDQYDKDKNAYCLSGISGGEIPTKITGAKQQDDILTINYEILDIKGEASYICEINIKLIDKDNYKYISFNTVNVNYEKAKKNRG